MARKRQDPAHLLRKAMLHRRAGIDGHRPVNHKADDLEGLEDIGARVQRVLDIVRSDKRRPTDMLFFVMYDIESNKVRRAVAKYLLRRGCHRVQKSIFLADISSEQCTTIQADLTEVQAMYDNQDSIFIVPMSLELVKSMKIIGKNLDLDLILKTRSTLCF
ncbi:MAG: CRISPR-associated endonuclease Cas2 [Muribaculaceae bacterium]|nr:CRISPR-associated endonuclease Cas2 [Muribaculaceae bacterium]